jgi:hypothetical protein
VFEQARQGFTTKSTKDTKVTKKASVRTSALHSLLFSSWCSWCPWWLICFLAAPPTGILPARAAIVFPD